MSKAMLETAIKQAIIAIFSDKVNYSIDEVVKEHPESTEKLVKFQQQLNNVLQTPHNVLIPGVAEMVCWHNINHLMGVLYFSDIDRLTDIKSIDRHVQLMLAKYRVDFVQYLKSEGIPDTIIGNISNHLYH